MKKRTAVSFLVSVFLSLAVLPALPLQAADMHRLLNLRGHWKFSIGDDSTWSDPKFYDGDWSEIYVPSSWEDEGYPGYDGYAWYRKHFRASDSWRTKDVVLDIGMIDDVDQVYVNGKLVGGTGSFPPEYETAYNAERIYSVPFDMLNQDGDNVIAVRVFDDHGVGGIVNGRIGFYEEKYYVDPDLFLPRQFKFKTGDDPDWSSPAFDDRGWTSIRVPGYWESQGFKNYDGYAWYRVKFNVPERLNGEKLIMLLGKIDDFDEVYLNGRRIGRTGPMPNYKMTYSNTGEYDENRAYTIPPGLIRFGKENVLAVRVYDCWQGGGIYEGPVGIVTSGHFRTRNYRHTYRSIEGWFENLFDDMFH